MNKYRLHIIFGTVLILVIGIAIPKLTVHDSVALTDTEKRCVQAGVKQQLDNPFQRVALALGKSAVIEKNQSSLTVKSYTVFRIPLPFTHLFNRFTTDVICDYATTEYNSNQLDISFTNKSLGFSIDQLDGVYFMGEKNGVVVFSLLHPDDPRQTSSIGLANMLTITSAQATPEEGKESEINGERVVISSAYGAYGGEQHWNYFFPSHDLLIQYVENKPIYEKMINTIRFK